MKTCSVLIVGCGDVGIRTGLLLTAHGWSVTGVRRDTAKLPAEFEEVFDYHSKEVIEKLNSFKFRKVLFEKISFYIFNC